MSRTRGVSLLIVAFTILAAACGDPTPTESVLAPRQGSGAASELARAACAMPHDELVRIWRGADPARSGDVILVPDEPNFLGSNFPHSGPWDYLQEVPLFWYGPGQVPPAGVIRRPVTVADIAPTQADLLEFGFTALDGKPMPEVLAGGRPSLPRLIVTLVWDGGGRSVLDTYPDEWPVLRSLIPKGVWFENATVGSSPSITPATHATMGTGAFPRYTGQVDAEFRLGNELVRSGALGPALLMEPTLADLYDRAMGNEPIVGGLASVTWHLNMMSHGAMWGGGDRDVAVLRTSLEGEGSEGDVWNLQGKNQPFYDFPAYVNRLPHVDTYVDELDRADGALDGRWGANSIAQLHHGWDTPARVPFQTRLVEEVIAREAFGADDVSDLLFINYKIIDHVGHVWSVNSDEMRDTLAWQDAGLRELIDFLDEQVGRRQWVLVLTADHGHQFDPEVSGAFQVTPGALEADLVERFDDADGVSALLGVRASQVFLNENELGRNGFTVDDVARFILDYTKAQAAPPSLSVPPTEQSDRVFSAAFPTSILGSLECLPEARA